MNIIAICLHCLDMRDFHSELRSTPFLDKLRKESVFIPMGRGQAHHQGESLNAEMTGVWNARCCNSKLTERGFISADSFWLPKTVIEHLKDADYQIITAMGCSDRGYPGLGTWAVNRGMEEYWLKDQPARVRQFNYPKSMNLNEWVEQIRSAKSKFYAHAFVRYTHRPWGQFQELFDLVGAGEVKDYPEDARCARRAALEKPDEFAALRRKGLAKASDVVQEIFRATKNKKDVAYVVYSNHGELFDHFRHTMPYGRAEKSKMIIGTSHGVYPYEVVYANMQMWLIPGMSPRVMQGIGRTIDIAPTMLELAGIQPEGMDGESMISHFNSGIFPARDRYAEMFEGLGCVSMVRSDGYKFLSTGLTPDHVPEVKTTIPHFHALAVFDLNTDPYEYVNLIDTPKGQEVLKWAIDKHQELRAHPTPTESTSLWEGTEGSSAVSSEQSGNWLNKIPQLLSLKAERYLRKRRLFKRTRLP